MIQPYTSPVVVNQSQELWLVGEGIATSGSLAIPSLDLNFVSGVMPGTVTFTRASSATFVGSNGLIQSATTNTPRFDYDPVTLAAKGLLIEEQRTNLLTYSEQFDNAVWTKSGLNTTGTPPWVNVAVAPDGTTTAERLIEDTSTGSHQIYVLPGLGINTYTRTIYAKANGRTQFELTQESGGNARFTLTGAGTAVALGSNTVSIQALDNGWYRCSSTFTVTGIFGLYLVLYNGSTTNYTGDGTSGIFIWGAQLEAGSFATSYIPTVASQATRSADVASVNTLSPWYNAAEGTLYAEATDGAPSSTARGVWSLDSGASNRIDLRRQTSTALWNVVTTGGVDQGILIYSNTAVNGVSFKNALAYKVNDLAGSVNGGSVQTDTSATIPSVTALQIGSLAAFGNPFNGHIRRITYYPRRLSNAELQAITA